MPPDSLPHPQACHASSPSAIVLPLPVSQVSSFATAESLRPPPLDAAHSQVSSASTSRRISRLRAQLGDQSHPRRANSFFDHRTCFAFKTRKKLCLHGHVLRSVVVNLCVKVIFYEKIPGRPLLNTLMREPSVKDIQDTVWVYESFRLHLGNKMVAFGFAHRLFSIATYNFCRFLPCVPALYLQFARCKLRQQCISQGGKCAGLENGRYESFRPQLNLQGKRFGQYAGRERNRVTSHVTPLGARHSRARRCCIGVVHELIA